MAQYLTHTWDDKEIDSFPLNMGPKVNPNCAVGGARGVMVIVVENGHGDSSSNPGRD